MFDPFLTNIYHVPWRRPVFLGEHVPNHDCIVVDPINDSLCLFLVGDAQLMTAPPDGGHWSRVRHAQLFPAL
jgi:hypothetical protein